MKTESSLFNSFESFCRRTLKDTDYIDYCAPIRKQAEASADWFQDAAQSLYEFCAGSWEKTGRQFGSVGKLGLICLVSAIAYNIFSGKQKPNKDLKERSSKHYHV